VRVEWDLSVPCGWEKVTCAEWEEARLERRNWLEDGSMIADSHATSSIVTLLTVHSPSKEKYLVADLRRGNSDISSRYPPTISALLFRNSSYIHKHIHNFQHNTTLLQSHDLSPFYGTQQETFNMSSENVPSGEFSDESYVSRPGQKQDPIPVTSDNAPVESGVNAETADSEEQLGGSSLRFP